MRARPALIVSAFLALATVSVVGLVIRVGVCNENFNVDLDRTLCNSDSTGWRFAIYLGAVPILFVVAALIARNRKTVLAIAATFLVTQVPVLLLFGTAASGI